MKKSHFRKFHLEKTVSTMKGRVYDRWVIDSIDILIYRTQLKQIQIWNIFSSSCPRNDCTRMALWNTNYWTGKDWLLKCFGHNTKGLLRKASNLEVFKSLFWEFPFKPGTKPDNRKSYWKNSESTRWGLFLCVWKCGIGTDFLVPTIIQLYFSMPLFYDWAKIHCSHFRNCSKKESHLFPIPNNVVTNVRGIRPGLWSFVTKLFSVSVDLCCTFKFKVFKCATFWLLKWTFKGLMAIAFTGFIIVLKINYCHRLSTEPGYRNCSVD